MKQIQMLNQVKKDMGLEGMGIGPKKRGRKSKSQIIVDGAGFGDFLKKAIGLPFQLATLPIKLMTGGKNGQLVELHKSPEYKKIMKLHGGGVTGGALNFFDILKNIFMATLKHKSSGENKSLFDGNNAISSVLGNGVTAGDIGLYSSQEVKASGITAGKRKYNKKGKGLTAGGLTAGAISKNDIIKNGVLVGKKNWAQRNLTANGVTAGNKIVVIKSERGNKKFLDESDVEIYNQTKPRKPKVKSVSVEMETQTEEPMKRKRGRPRKVKEAVEIAVEVEPIAKRTRKRGYGLMDVVQKVANISPFSNITSGTPMSMLFGDDKVRKTANMLKGLVGGKKAKSKKGSKKKVNPKMAKRAVLVKKIMAERNVSMLEASKIIKAENLKY